MPRVKRLLAMSACSLACFGVAAGTATIAATSAPDGQAPEKEPRAVRAAGPEIEPAPQPGTAEPDIALAPSPAGDVRTPETPEVADREASEPTEVLHGDASWYGPGFEGNTTASGETYDSSEMTAAHKTLPLGTTVRVTNEDNGETVTVRINDRGPYSGGRILDVSSAAADELGMKGAGVVPVEIEVL